MTTSTMDKPIEGINAKSPYRIKRVAAKMSIENMLKYSKLQIHVIRNLESNINFSRVDPHVCKIYDQAIADYAKDRVRRDNEFIMVVDNTNSNYKEKLKRDMRSPCSPNLCCYKDTSQLWRKI